MAFNSNELGVIRTYVAITGEAPTQAELQAAFDKTGLNSLATDLIQSRPAQGNTAFVTSLYENLLGRAPDAEGLEYWTSLLSSSAGPNQLSKARLAVEFQNAAALNADSEEDFVDGTAGLSSVNGKFAEPTNPEDPEEPVEDITFEFNFDTTKGASDVAGWTHTKSDETGQISNTTGADTYMSNTNKIYNVGMEAIDQGVGTISRDYTFRTENQLGDHGHYEAYFLSPVLDNVTTNLGSVLTVEVIDRMAEANNKDAALSLVAIESFSFRLNGEQVVVGSQDILNAESYEELAAAIEARINELAKENPALANVSVSLGADFTRQQVDADTLETTGANVLGTQIVVTATGNNLIERGGFAFGEREGGDRNVDPSGRQDTTVLGSETDLVTTNLEFKNVGYGSQGGSVNVSGQSLSDRGVEQFDIVAEKHNLGLGVWLTELSSQPLKNRALNTLEVINLTGAADYFHVGIEQTSAENVDGGSVRSGKAFAGLTDVRVFNASQFNQNVRINAEVTSDVVARDLNLVDDAANPAGDNVVYSYNLGGGDNQLFLSFSQEVIAHEDASLSITSGSGNDKVHVVLDNDDAAPSEWLANQQDLKNIVINTGSGNDVVWTEGEGDATIFAGAGNDLVFTDNSGVQTVIVDNSTATTADVKAHWVFNNDTATDADNVFDLNGFGGTNSVVGFMPNAKLTVTFSGATTAGGGVMNGAAAAFANGFESVVDIPTGPNYVVTRANLNQAVKDAINNDDVLSKLLVAKDGPDNTLIIESLIDGTFAATDLSFDVAGVDLSTLTTAEQGPILSAYQDLVSDSTATIANAQTANSASLAAADAINPAAGVADDDTTTITGSASSENSNNVIDLGAGNDVVVLGTEANSNDTLVFNGVFGYNTVVNFEDTVVAGLDQLDFTAYLTTETSASGSSASAVTVGVTGVDSALATAATTLAANSVTEITGFDSSLVAGETWDALSASDLLAAIQDTNPAGYGNLGDIDPQAALANLVGNSRSHILAIENDNNAGEYKFFHVTSSDDGTVVEFTNATLIGTVDFGANVDFATNDILVG